MSQRSVRVILEEMLNSMQAIQIYVQGITEEAFTSDPMRQDAVIRRLEILGEAANQLPDDWKQGHPEIPWQVIADMRHRLIHGYFAIDLGIVWQTVEHDLPPLRQQLTHLIELESADE